MAMEPISGAKRKSYQDFSGGLNTLNAALTVPQNQFTELTNCLVNSRGILEKSKGYVVDGSPFPNSADSSILMLANYRRGTTVNKLVVAAKDAGNTNNTYKIDLKETNGDGAYAYVGHTAGTSASFTSGDTAVTGVGTSWLSHLKTGDKIKAAGHADSAYTEIASVTNDTTLVLVAGGYLGATAASTTYKARKILNKDFIPSAIVFNNNLVITNGSDKPMTYNNTTLNDITNANAPKARFIEPHNSRVFMAYTPGGPSSIYWSAVNDETSWDAAAFEIVYANDNGNIAGIRSFADSLIVLKDNGNIYQVFGAFDQDAVGEPDFIRKVDAPANIGTIAGFSAVIHDDNKLYFLAETGIYSIDSRMAINKVSWDIQPTVEDVVLESGLTSAKSFTYDTNAQFDSGTHSGTVAKSGSLSNFNDKLTITDANKDRNLLAQAIDSSNNIHIAYVDATNNKKIRYTKWLASDNTIAIADTVIAGPIRVMGLAIAVDSSGNAGVTWLDGNGTNSYSDRSTLYYSTRASGSWSTKQEISSIASSSAKVSHLSMAYNSSDIACLAYSLTGSNGDTSSSNVRYTARSVGTPGSTWSTPVQALDKIADGLSMVLDANNPKISVLYNDATNRFIQLVSSSDAGATFSSVDTVTISADNLGVAQAIKVVRNNAGTYHTVFSEANAVKRRNHTAGTTTTLDTTTGVLFLGYQMEGASDNDYLYTSTSVGTEKYYFESATTITNSTTETLDEGFIAISDSALIRRGAVYSSAAFGANANEIIVRRLAFRAVWTSPEDTDADLSSWGTFDPGSVSTNGNTITYEVALNTISPATTYSAVTAGQIISTDATNVFARTRITFVLNSFNQSSVGSVILNYYGPGVGAFLPTGIVYDNELYLSYGTASGSANSGVLLYDRTGAWSIQRYPVLFMVRYRGLLYGGSSTNGDVYKLISGYREKTAAYTATAVTKEDLLGSIELLKDIFKLYIVYEIKTAGTFNFSYRTDNYATVGGSTWNTTTIDQTVSGLAEIPVTSGLAKSIQFKIESSGLDDQLGIVGWVVLYEYANLR